MKKISNTFTTTCNKKAGQPAFLITTFLQFLDIKRYEKQDLNMKGAQIITTKVDYEESEYEK